MDETAPLHRGVPLAQARVVCVFVHGRTQSPEEMEEHVVRHLTVPGVAWVLPRAAGRVWYAARAVDPLTDDTRTALAAARAQVARDVAAARAAAPGAPLVLAGFSQGACLTLEYLLAGGGGVDAAAAFTGCRVSVPADDLPRADLAGLPVYLTGGDADPWIPVDAFAAAAGALGHARAALRADLFPGRPHEVSAPERAVLAAMLTALAEGRAPLERAP
jgi:phospholipase/carboxylesterase